MYANSLKLNEIRFQSKNIIVFSKNSNVNVNINAIWLSEISNRYIYKIQYEYPESAEKIAYLRNIFECIVFMLKQLHFVVR